MSEPEQPTLMDDPTAAKPNAANSLLRQASPLLLSVPLLTLLTGVIFPLVLWGLAHLLFPHQSEGSLLRRHGVPVGSDWIGQNFSQPGYFHGRPSAADYDARTSGGTNLASTNSRLRDGGPTTSAPPFVGVRQLAADYRRRNGLPPDVAVPIDAVTYSGSGLDPHISPANAGLQVPRVARQRQLDEDVVRQLVADYTDGPQLGVLGEPRVSVLPLNLALDRMTRSGRPAE